MIYLSAKLSFTIFAKSFGQLAGIALSLLLLLIGAFLLFLGPCSCDFLGIPSSSAQTVSRTILAFRRVFSGKERKSVAHFSVLLPGQH